MLHEQVNSETDLKFGHKKLYIGGELTNGVADKRFDLICPATEEAVGTAAEATLEDTQETLEAAQKGFEYWSKLPMKDRLAWIKKLREGIIAKSDQLREAMMYEMGKTWEGSEEDIVSITNSLQFYPEEIQRRSDIAIADKEGTHSHKLVHQPLGVVVAFLAWNFPLLNLGFKLGPALAAGCSIVIKPSNFSALSAYMIAEICDEIDFPKGVVNIICGDRHNVGIPLCESTIPKLITLIGATSTGQKLIEQSSRTSIKRYSMECGGNAPFLVFDDADIDHAVTIGAALKKGNSGQICVAPNRFFIQDTIVEEYITKLQANFDDVVIGFGRENGPDMGPLANELQLKEVESYVEQAIAEGGKLIMGGKRLDRKGYYFPPTIIVMDDPKAPVLQREIFGPVATILSFNTKEEAIEMANDTDAGLASYVFSTNEQTIEDVMMALEFGEVQVNGVKYDIYLPHGGIKNSGISVDCSEYALDDYLVKKRVSRQL